MLAVQFAVHLGAEVYAVDMRPSSRELALEFGAKEAFDLPQLDVESTRCPAASMVRTAQLEGAREQEKQTTVCPSREFSYLAIPT